MTREAIMKSFVVDYKEIIKRVKAGKDWEVAMLCLAKFTVCMDRDSWRRIPFAFFRHFSPPNTNFTAVRHKKVRMVIELSREDRLKFISILKQAFQWNVGEKNETNGQHVSTLVFSILKSVESTAKSAQNSSLWLLEPTIYTDSLNIHVQWSRSQRATRRDYHEIGSSCLRHFMSRIKCYSRVENLIARMNQDEMFVNYS